MGRTPPPFLSTELEGWGELGTPLRSPHSQTLPLGGGALKLLLLELCNCFHQTCFGGRGLKRKPWGTPLKPRLVCHLLLLHWGAGGRQATPPPL